MNRRSECSSRPSAIDSQSNGAARNLALSLKTSPVNAVAQDSRAVALAWQSGHGGLPAVLELTDLAPLALRERVRSLVWLRGTVHPVPPNAERILAGIR